MTLSNIEHNALKDKAAAMLVLLVGVPIHYIVLMIDFLICFHSAGAPSGSGPHYQGFTIKLIYTALGRTPLDE